MPVGLKEKRHVIGNDFIDYSGVDADRCDPDLASQQGVGLWSERRARAGIAHRDYSVAAGTIVTCPARLAAGRIADCGNCT
jgi:hypothetical protein